MNINILALHKKSWGISTDLGRFKVEIFIL